MSRALRYVLLIPLSVQAFYMLFVLPDIDLGWPGGLAMLGAAWLVWYLLWATMQKSAAAARTDESVAAVSPGEQRAWIGLIFALSLAITFAFSPLVHLAWAKPMTLPNLLMTGVIPSSLLAYAATGLTYWHDRRGA